MELFRLCRSAYTHDLSGRGAGLYGARWNSKGTDLLYTAQNRSLAMAEVVVHLSLSALPQDYCMVKLLIPDEVLIEDFPLSSLPQDWAEFPHPASTKVIGDAFVRHGKYCMLRVPSAITAGDFNILLNPAHPDFKHLQIAKILPFPFNKRIVCRHD